MTVLHAKALTLARHLSTRNEPDLLQETFASDYDENEENSKPDRERCLILLGKALKSSDVPVSCLAYKDIQQKLKRKDSKHDYAVAFEGMASGEATAAMAARDKGMLHHAQVQRRMTKPQYRKFY